MGTRQVPRVAVGLILLLAARPVRADEAVIVIDLRPGDPAALGSSRADFLRDLKKVGGIAVKGDGALDGALGGAAAGGDDAEITAALDEARAAFGALDCAKARAAADRAIDLLAARQASGVDAAPSLRGAWAYVLLCADQAGDRVAAQTAADRLRVLGATTAEEAGIPDKTWARYPEIDATTDRDIVALAVPEPVGATVFVDHVRAGPAPVTVYVPAGEHVVAGADGARRGATRVTVAGKPVTVTLTLVERAAAHADLAATIAGWRDGAHPPTAEALGAVMRALEVRFALILAGKETVQVWAMARGDRRPRKIDDASRADVMGIGAMILDRAAAWDGNAPDPDVPLLRETDVERARRKGPEDKWWIYAAIIGAVATGTAILYFQDAADDHQRIEIRWP